MLYTFCGKLLLEQTGYCVWIYKTRFDEFLVIYIRIYCVNLPVSRFVAFGYCLYLDTICGYTRDWICCLLDVACILKWTALLDFLNILIWTSCITGRSTDHWKQTLCVSGRQVDHRLDCWIQWTNLSVKYMDRTVARSDCFFKKFLYYTIIV